MTRKFPKPKLTPEQFAAARDDQCSVAPEVLEHIYNALVGLPPIKLKDGSTVTVETYIAPEMADDGQVQCGFDVRLPDGGHLEFMVKNTGWGKSFAKGIEAERKEKDGRGKS